MIDIEQFFEKPQTERHKKRLGLVRTEPKGQKLKISELMSKLIQNNMCNIILKWLLQNV